MKVLVVDNNTEGRALLSELLKSNNHEVEEAANCIDALNSMKFSRPDLIISNMMMYEMDGFAFICELRKMDHAKKIPFMFYSEQCVNENDKRFAQKLGASGFLFKSAQPNDVLNEIEAVIKEVEYREPTSTGSITVIDEEYLNEYSKYLVRKLEDKVSELEKEITQRKHLEMELQDSTERQRSMFENLPISLWEEDFSEVKKHLDDLRAKGINDFRKYFHEHPQEVANCVTMSKVIDVNKATLQLYEACNKEQLMAGLGIVFGKESYDVFREELIALAEGKVEYEAEDINYTFTGKKMHIILKLSVVQGYEDTLSKILVSISDITQRKKMEEALRGSEGRLQSILDNSSTVVFLKDLEGRFITVNRRFEELFHVTRETVVGKSDHEIFPSEYADRFRRHDVLALKKGGPLEVEEFVPQDDGLHVYISVKFPLFTTEQKPYAVCGIATDITDRKRAEEKITATLNEKEILLREVHHRVKNNMQVIISLLELQSGFIKNKKYVEMFRESQNRIKSMSLIHEKLYQSMDLAKVEFNEYIKELTDGLFKSSGVKTDMIELKINIENVLIGIDIAIPCGLIINELISNSLKYAFPGDRKGEIDISLQLLDQHMVKLTVSDNGVGIPSDVNFRKYESLGLRLVTLLAENQLKGNIYLDRRKGTEFNIIFQDHEEGINGKKRNIGC